jgi:hypothetical protein
MYSLFQLHTTEQLKAADGYFCSTQDNGLSWSMMIGPRMAVAALDTRSGRSRNRIVPPELIDELCNRVRCSSVLRILTGMLRVARQGLEGASPAASRAVWKAGRIVVLQCDLRPA